MNESSSERILDVAAIREILPHRYPFLLVDRIVELEADRVVAHKGVTANEPYFQGHFPGRSIMPGVLIVEGLGQAGTVGVLQERESSAVGVHLAAIEKARFRRPVTPGDQLVYRVTVGKPRRGFVALEGIASVDGETAVEAALTLSIQSEGDL